ncbi:MAG: hypothetical protein HYW25_04985 [Candidatus Aenigmarchaeota archaeon]|nr:hypothetical protein [Candidatus Aenigmarchaeota archaeon]
MAQKGISLPIEMIIVIAVAVLVLIVIAAFFISGGGSGIGRITDDAAFSQGCVTLRFTYNCARSANQVTIPDYQLPGGQSGTLLDACQRKLGVTMDDTQCKIACGCR